jgi:iron complex transport system ATP-binding protein
VITAADIHRRQGGLAGISLAIPPGMMTAIIGPNGAGKSTLLDLLAGRTQPDSGEITFGGTPIEDWSALALARRRAFLPQAPEVAFQVRVRDLVALGRSPYHGTPGALVDPLAIETALKMTDAWQFRDRLYHRISGGERQRVQLARVITQLWRPPQAEAESRYLMLDEPTASLDPGHRLAVMRLLRGLVRDGIGVVIALHDLNDAARFADDVVLLERGRVIGRGAPEDVLRAETLSAAYGAEAELLRAGDGQTAIVFR